MNHKLIFLLVVIIAVASLAGCVYERDHWWHRHHEEHHMERGDERR